MATSESKSDDTSLKTWARQRECAAKKASFRKSEATRLASITSHPFPNADPNRERPRLKEISAEHDYRFRVGLNIGRAVRNSWAIFWGLGHIRSPHFMAGSMNAKRVPPYSRKSHSPGGSLVASNFFSVSAIRTLPGGALSSVN